MKESPFFKKGNFSSPSKRGGLNGILWGSKESKIYPPSNGKS